MLNYCMDTNHDLAIRYLYKTENMAGINHDHDYLSLPLMETWIDNVNNANKIVILMLGLHIFQNIGAIAFFMFQAFCTS